MTRVPCDIAAAILLPFARSHRNGACTTGLCRRILLFVHRHSLVATTSLRLHVQSPTMRFLRQSFIPFAAIALLYTSLSACAPDMPRPTTLAPPSAASSASPEVTTSSPEPEQAAAPVMPAEAHEQTAAGAIVFVRHYFAAVDYAYATGDTAPLANISDPECLPCAAIKEMIDATVAAGDTYDVDHTQLLELSVPDGEPRGAVEVHVLHSDAGAIRLDAEGKEVSRLKPTVSERLRVVLVPADSGWRIYDSGEMN